MPKTLKKFFHLLAVFLLILISDKKVFAAETQIKYVSISTSVPEIDTGYDITKGDPLTVRQWSTGGGGIYYPGRTTKPWIPLSAAGDPGCNAVEDYRLNGVKCWSLIGRIGNGDPFYIGFDSSFNDIQQEGRLYLGFNYRAPLLDASGSWPIQIIHNMSDPEPKPEPFSDLLWSYATKSASFTDAALSINSYFDHEYPLLSTYLSEPSIAALSSTLIYKGLRSNEKNPYSYSSHDGYDYGGDAGTKEGVGVLASAAGCARYKYSGSEGNSIRIDHGNNFETRYLHLKNSQLITKSGTDCVNVSQGQQIGLVGHTGNVSPEGYAGSHIHFSVVEDKDKDGDFQDNIPDGLIDPFGWSGTEDDPWPGYEFNYKGEDRTGNESHYLWIHPLIKKEVSTPADEETTTVLENVSVTFPVGMYGKNTTANLFISPTTNQIGDKLLLYPAVEITLHDWFGNAITELSESIEFTFDYSNVDISPYNIDTAEIYTSNDGVNWEALATQLNKEAKAAFASSTHLSYFALVAELNDAEAPLTVATVEGTALEEKEYQLPLEISLEASDSSQIQYTTYILNESEWENYSDSLSISETGDYHLKYYSEDEWGNVEEVNEIDFSVINQPIQAEIQFRYDSHSKDIVALALPLGESTLVENMVSKYKTEYVVTSSSDQTLRVWTSELDRSRYDYLGIQAIQYGDEEKISVGRNRLQTTSGRNGSLIQTSRNDNEYYRLNYSRRRDKTNIYHRQGRQRTRQWVNGKRYLQLETNEGELVYTISEEEL